LYIIQLLKIASKTGIKALRGESETITNTFIFQGADSARKITGKYNRCACRIQSSCRESYYSVPLASTKPRYPTSLVPSSKSTLIVIEISWSLFFGLSTFKQSVVDLPQLRSHVHCLLLRIAEGRNSTKRSIRSIGASENLYWISTTTEIRKKPLCFQGLIYSRRSGGTASSCRGCCMGLEGFSAHLVFSEEPPLPSVVLFSITVCNTVSCSFSERLLLRVLLSNLPSSIVH
jgi:hypothetical protein